MATSCIDRPYKKLLSRHGFLNEYPQDLQFPYDSEAELTSLATLMQLEVPACSAAQRLLVP